MLKTVLLDPIEKIPQLFKFDGYEGKNFYLGHIKFDESLNDNYDYQIIRESSHDGTLIFTEMLIAEALEPLVNKYTYCKKDFAEDQLVNVSDIDYYTIGNIKLESKYVDGKKMTNTVYIPVRCKYTFKEIKDIIYSGESCNGIDAKDSRVTN